jgi:hypothetical protein
MERLDKYYIELIGVKASKGKALLELFLEQKDGFFHDRPCNVRHTQGIACSFFW